MFQPSSTGLVSHCHSITYPCTRLGNLKSGQVWGQSLEAAAGRQLQLYHRYPTHATDTWIDKPCTKVWVIPCLSQVSLTGQKISDDLNYILLLQPYPVNRVIQRVQNSKCCSWFLWNEKERAEKLRPLVSLSTFRACCDGHPNWLAQRAKMCDTNHIPLATAKRAPANDFSSSVHM